MPKNEPPTRAEMQYLLLSKSFFNILCAIAFIAVIHQFIVRLFFPGVGLELLTGGVMIGVVFIGAPIAYIKSRRDARRLCSIEATIQSPQNPPS